MPLSCPSFHLKLIAYLPTPCAEAGGPFGIDHELSLDQSGIWERKYSNGLENGVMPRSRARSKIG